MLEPLTVSHDDLSLQGAKAIVEPSTLEAEAFPLTIAKFIKLIDSCLINCDPSEEQNLAPLKSYKGHLERLLKKKGDQAMDWLDCDYFEFEYGLPTEKNYAIPLAIPIQVIFQGLEHIQKGVQPAPKWSQNFNALMNFLKLNRVFQVQQDRLDFKLAPRSIIKCSAEDSVYFGKIDHFIYSCGDLSELMDKRTGFNEISKISLFLRKKNLLTPKITSFILSLPEKALSELYGILKQLDQLNLLTDQNLDALLKSSALIDSLEEGYCFQSSIFSAPRSRNAFRFMSIISAGDYFGVRYFSKQASFFDQEVFDQAIHYYDILTHLSLVEFWDFLQFDLNRSSFDQIIQLCETYKEDVDTASRKVAELLNAFKWAKRLKQDHTLHVFQHKTWFDRALPASVVLSVQNQTPPVLIKVSPVFGRDAYYLYGLSKDGQAKLTKLSANRNTMINGFRPTHGLRYGLSHDLSCIRDWGDCYVFFPQEAHVSLEYTNRVRRLSQYANVIYAVRGILDRLPNHLLRTSAVFDDILDLCEQHQGDIEGASRAITELIDNRLRQEYQNNHRDNINYSQSIHADSVHKTVSQSVMRLAGTGFDLALNIFPSEEGCTLETLKTNKYPIPCLIKQELTDGTTFFYLYGRTREGNPTLTLLDEASEIWQKISFDHRDKTIWVSQNENQPIYQAIRQTNMHFSGYPGVIADSSKVKRAIKELQEWGKTLGKKPAIESMLKEGCQGLDISTKEKAKLRAELEFKQQKAQEAVGTLTKPSYQYNDSGSGISVRQMLALVWIAIHDNRPEIGRKGGLESAKRLLMEAFYEIQEGYNLDAQGNRQNSLREDPSICVSGSFNKVLEKLQGVHPDVQIDFITRETFSLKLRAMVQEEAIKHLTDFREDGATVKKAGNFSPISENITPVIREKIENEFSEKLPVKPEEVSNILETILSTNLPENFYKKYSQIFSESDVVETEKEAAPQPSTSDNRIINVNLGKYGVLTVNNTSKSDVLSCIKAHLKQENVISEETYDNTVVKVIFSGKVYKTDSSTLEVDNQQFYQALKTACQLTGTDTVTVIVQIAVPKKQEEPIQPFCPKDLTQTLCYQALIDRIEIVRKRVDENSKFQVQAKNQAKLNALSQIQQKFAEIEENSCSAQEIYEFLTSQPIKDVICQSTSKLPTFFQDPVDSNLLLQALIDKLQPLVNPLLLRSQADLT